MKAHPKPRRAAWLLLAASIAGACTTGTTASPSIQPSLPETPPATQPSETDVPHSQPPSPSATPLPPLSSSYASSRFRYRISYPSNWTLTAGDASWPYGGDGEAPSAGQFDEFLAPDGETLSVTSQVLPQGLSEAAWFEAYLAGAAHAACFPERSAWTPVEVDGHAGGLHGGLPTCNFTEVVLIVGRRAYVVTGVPDPRPMGHVFDEALFAAFLASISLDPSG